MACFSFIPPVKTKFMKRIFTPLIAAAVVTLSSFVLQSSIDDVINALRTGDSSDISKYFDDNVELTVPDKSDNYSKAQAQLIIKDFFKNNGVKGFELKHKGDSPGGHFAI